MGAAGRRRRRASHLRTAMTPPPDESHAPRTPAGWRPPWVPLGILAGCALAVLAARATRIDSTPDPDPTPATTFRPRGNTWPVTDTTPVIGVTVGTRHRAYLLSDYWAPPRHVQNDSIGTTPVTVTFCNLSNCVLAVAGDDNGPPLPVTNGGRHPTKAGRMVLSYGGRKFEQETLAPLDGDTARPFPYKTVPAERTTWGEWSAKHPDTDLSGNGQLYTPPKP